MEIWARLLLYNFCSIITGHVAITRKGKKHTLQVNYSVAFKVCHYFLRLHNGESPPDVESLIEKGRLMSRTGCRVVFRFRKTNYIFCEIF